MKELTATDWFTITGRGMVAAVDLRQVAGCPDRINSVSEMPVRVGEQVMIDGNEYTITTIEYTTALIYPPFIKPAVGLMVRPVLKAMDAVDNPLLG